ncbi:MAG: alpha/beta hydrolase [Planctomycetota bacterium]
MNGWSKLVGIGCILAAIVAIPRQTLGDDVKILVRKGLTYSDADAGLGMDLFLPKDSSHPVPCIVVIQGGGFLPQDGQRFRPFAEHLAEHGFAAALISYRGRPKHTYQETMSDVKAAVRFVRKISVDHGIDASRIGAMGRSAGATLAVLLAVAGDDDSSANGNHGDSSGRIQAAVGIAGVYDFVGRFESDEQTTLQPKASLKKRTNGEWIGKPYSSTDADWLRASAINSVDAADPPLCLLHSRDDQVVPWMQSREMHDAVLKAGGRSQLVISENGGHGGPEESKEVMVSFFKDKLAH